MRIAIPEGFKYQILYFLCIVIPYLNIYELTLLIWSLTFLSTLSGKYSMAFLKMLTPYFLILILAIIVGLYYIKFYKLFFVIRDITYLLKPIIGLLCGYQLAKYNYKNTLKLIINTGVFISVCHLLLVLNAIIIENARTVGLLRHYAGFFSDYEVYVLIILLFNKEFGLNYSRKVWWALLLIVGTSSFMYLARTNFIQFVIFYLALKGYFVINVRSIIVITSIIISAVLAYSVILYINPKRKAKGFEGFLYKIKVAPLEPFKTKINTEDYVDFNDNYRSHENIMTISQVSKGGVIPVIFGKGIGSQIDLKQEVYLGDMYLRYISILHNGFMIVFLKSGLLGVFIYLFSIRYFFKNPYSKDETINQINLLFLGTGIFLILSNWVFLGFYNLTETKTVLIGFLIYYREKLLRDEKYSIHTPIR